MLIKRKPRGKGKTTELVKMSAQNNVPILCAHREMARNTKCVARDLGLKIPEPLIVENFKNERYLGRRIGKILIDDLEMVLYEMFGSQVELVTTSAIVEFEENEGCSHCNSLDKLSLHRSQNINATQSYVCKCPGDTDGTIVIENSNNAPAYIDIRYCPMCGKQLSR